MLQDFKAFLKRGKVVQLAAVVIIGTAFTSVVTTVANNWIGPLIAALGGADANGLAITLAAGNPKSVVDIGGILTAVITFGLIVLAVYYLIVVPEKEFQLRRQWGLRTGQAEPTEVELLTEIRGLLSQQNHGTALAAVPSPHKRVDGDGRLMVAVNPRCSSRLVMFPGNRPGLVIDYGGQELVFGVGHGIGSVANAHEFAVGLAHAALNFANRCHLQMSPRHARRATGS